MGKFYVYIFACVGLFNPSSAQEFKDSDLPSTSKRMASYAGDYDFKERLRIYLRSYKWQDTTSDGVSGPSSKTLYLDVVIKFDPNDPKNASFFKFNRPSADSSGAFSTLALLPDKLKNVTNHLPKEVEDISIVRESIFTYYPNCFGTARTLYDPPHDFGFVGSYDFASYLRSHFEMIRPGQAVTFGDIMTVFKFNGVSENAQLVHASIVVDRNFVWGKSSAYPDDPWTFRKLEDDFFIQFNAYKTIATDDGHVFYGDFPYFGNFRVIFWKARVIP